MSGFSYEWLQQVYGERSAESLDESSSSPTSTSVPVYESPLTLGSSSYLGGYQSLAAAYSNPNWAQCQTHSHPHLYSHPRMHAAHTQAHDFSSSSGELSNANVTQNQDQWSHYDRSHTHPYFHGYHHYSPTEIAHPHDAMSTCSQDSIKSTPEIASSTQTDLQLPSMETHESSPENATVLHHWVQLGTVTTSRSIKQFIVDASTPERKLFFCAWDGCQHPLGFPNKSQLMTHVRALHLQEKPFLCTTCRTYFARKQDAIRHVNTANSGKRYECGLCDKSFARKSYRDSHQNLCNERRVLLASVMSSRSRT